MSYCDGKIVAGLVNDCATLPAAGYEAEGVIINRADIDFSTATVTGNVLTDIPLKSGKKGYKLEQKGARPFADSTSEAEVGTYATTFNKNVAFAVLSNDPEHSDFIDSVANGEFVVVLKAKDKGKDNKGAFKVFGWHNGLKVSAISHDPYGDAKGGAVVTLTEEQAPLYALYLGATYQAGQQAFDALTAEE